MSVPPAKDLNEAAYAVWVLVAIDRFGNPGTSERAQKAAQILVDKGLAERTDSSLIVTPTGQTLLAKFLAR